jgi:hypothetical protein
MASPNRVIAAGSHYNQIFFYDTSGHLTGSTTTAPSTGATGSPAYHIIGWQTGSPTVNEPDSVVIEADDSRLGEFQFDSVAERRFTVDVAVNDMTLFARMLGTNVQTLGEMKLGALDITDADDINCGLIIQGKAKKYDGGVKGVASWQGTLVPLAVARPLGRVDYGTRAAAVFRFSVSPQVADKHPWGITINDATAGTSGLTYMPFTAENPVALHTWRGNGVLDTFTTQHTPISTAKTYVVTRIPGGGAVVATVSAVTPASKSIQLGSVPADGAEVHSLYELSAFVE